MRLADALVGREGALRALVLDFDGQDLLLELAGVLRGARAALALDGERVEVLARDAPLARDVVGSDALRRQVVGRRACTR